MVSPEPQMRYSVAEYLMLERGAKERHEYLDGQAYPMADESPEHSTICINLLAIVGSQLRGTPCQVFASDTKVRCGPAPRPGYPMKSLFAYPDLFVTCGEPQFHGSYRDVLLNPTLIIEVLSASTEAFDRGKKFRRYRTWLPTLTDYLLVAQDEPLIDYYHQVEANRWELVSLDGLETELSLESLDCILPLAEVYDGIVFPAEAPDLGQESPVI